MFIRLALLSLLFVQLLTGCVALRPEPPEVQLSGLEISDISLTHANFLANLGLYNPNNSAIEVEALEVALFLKEIRVARGATAKSFSIPAEQTGNATLRLSTSFIDLFRLSQQLKDLNEVPFRIAGEVRIGGPGFLWVTVPLDSEGTIPLVGALGEFFSGPDEFMRKPGRLFPSQTDTTIPKTKGL